MTVKQKENDPKQVVCADAPEYMIKTLEGGSAIIKIIFGVPDKMSGRHSVLSLDIVIHCWTFCYLKMSGILCCLCLTFPLHGPLLDMSGTISIFDNHWGVLVPCSLLNSLLLFLHSFCSLLIFGVFLLPIRFNLPAPFVIFPLLPIQMGISPCFLFPLCELHKWVQAKATSYSKPHK